MPEQMPPVRGVSVCMCVYNTWPPCWLGRNVQGWGRCGWKFLQRAQNTTPGNIKRCTRQQDWGKSGECAALIKPASVLACFSVCVCVSIQLWTSRSHQPAFFLVFLQCKWLFVLFFCDVALILIYNFRVSVDFLCFFFLAQVLQSWCKVNVFFVFFKKLRCTTLWIVVFNWACCFATTWIFCHHCITCYTAEYWSILLYVLSQVQFGMDQHKQHKLTTRLLLKMYMKSNPGVMSASVFTCPEAQPEVIVSWFWNRMLWS